LAPASRRPTHRLLPSGPVVQALAAGTLWTQDSSRGNNPGWGRRTVTHCDVGTSYYTFQCYTFFGQVTPAPPLPRVTGAPLDPHGRHPHRLHPLVSHTSLRAGGLSGRSGARRSPRGSPRRPGEA